MKALIVLAHEEPRSFNGALRDTAVATLRGMGMEVMQSDLYAMNFNPVGGKHDFTRLANPDYFKYGPEQTAATEAKTFKDELKLEQEKLFAADLLIFQFPLWWFGLPAILKGWVDRVFAAGLTYGGSRLYSNGVFRGKRAICCLTTGGPGTMYEPTGLNGDIREILFPIEHGMFNFVGFDVLPAHVCYGVARATPEQRQAYLEGYAEKLRHWQSAPTLPFRPMTDYDTTMRLKPGLGSPHPERLEF